MGERGLNRLFLRYRSKGDARALGEVFDQVAPELLRLSMHLVRDPGEAEDVLQATFLAAIEGAGSFDGKRPLMPWLTGILARQAGLARRRARRVVEPDRLQQREPDDPAEAAALREFSAELVLALEALPENYREVLWMHLADGQRPIEIAQSLQRAPGTVRMQVHRGLELLRRALPAGYGAGAGLFGATRGMAAVRAEVLGAAAARWQAGPAATASAPTAASAPVALAGSSMFLKLALGLAVCAALAATVWWRVQPNTSNGGLARGETAGTSVESELLATPLSGGSAERSALPRENSSGAQTASKAAQPGAILLRGRVLGCAPDEFSNVRLSVRGIARFALPAELDVHGLPDAEGRFELDVTALLAAAKPKRPIEELVLEADHPRYVRETQHIPIVGAADVGSESRPSAGPILAEITLRPAGILSGRVLRPDNTPAAAAPIALYEIAGGKPLEPAVEHAQCAADGSFTLRARASGEHVLLILDEDLRPASVGVTALLGRTQSLGTLLLEQGAVIEGRARQAGLSIGAGALVSATATGPRASHAFEGARLVWADAAFERAGRSVETDSDGHFRIAGLAPGEYRLGVARAAPEAQAATQGRLLLSTAAWTVVNAPASAVEIDASFATVHFQLRAASGESPSGIKPAQVRWQQGSHGTAFALELDGLASLSVEPLSTCRVRVELEGFVGQELEFAAPAPGEESNQTLLLQRDPQLAALTVELRLPAGAADELPSEASFQFRPAQDNPTASFVRHTTGSAGRFELGGLPAGEWNVSVFAGGVYEHYRNFWCEALTNVRLSPAGSANAAVLLQRGGQLQVCARNASGACLPAACTLRTAAGDRLKVEFVGRGPQGTLKSATTLNALGSSDVHPILRAGRYELEFSAPGYTTSKEFVVIEAGTGARVDALLQPQVRER